MKDKIIKGLVICTLLVTVFVLWYVWQIDVSIKTLLMIMFIDYIIGISLAVAGKSKHGDGKLSSKTGYKGIVKKIITLLLIGLGTIIDNYLAEMGVNYQCIQDIAVLAFGANELISIIENTKLMGLDIVEIVKKVLEVINLKKK